METIQNVQAEEAVFQDGAQKPTRLKKRRYRKEDAFWGLVFGGIPLLGLFLFTFIPTVMAFSMSLLTMPKFFSFEGAYFAKTASGLPFQNFADVIKDGAFWNALKNNCIVIVSVPVSIVVSVVCAELLSKKLRGTNVYKVILFIPYVCSVTATTLMWQWIFDANYGVINQIFHTDKNWLDADNLLWTVVIMNVWSATGYRILLFTAAITNVNGSLKESAQLDGANFFQVFVHITIPAITPTIFYVLVMGTINSLQEFTRIQLISPTGKDGLCLTAVFYIYQEGFSYTNAGVACAASIVLTVIILIITRLHFYLSKKWVSYDAA
ncbi:MAG: carbohydrate ABC transporter permease [Candidatus Scatosoma sp.]